MKNVKIKTVIVALTALAMMLTPFSALSGKEKGMNEGMAALVNGKGITIKKLDQEFGKFQAQMAQRKQQIPPDLVQNLRSRLLDDLVNMELLYQEAKKRGMKADQKAVDDQIENIKKNFPDEETFRKYLTSVKTDEAAITEELDKGFTIQALVEKDVISTISVTNDETKAFYDNNQEKFSMPEQVRASHILIKADSNADEATKAKAKKAIKKIQKKLKKGGDFVALAKEFSECNSKANGGDLDFFDRGKMVPPFEEAAFALKKGEMSNIVETRFGYHLIKVTDKKASSVVSYDEAKERISEQLKRQKISTEMQQYIEKLTKAAKIEKFL